MLMSACAKTASARLANKPVPGFMRITWKRVRARRADVAASRSSKSERKPRAQPKRAGLLEVVAFPDMTAGSIGVARVKTRHDGFVVVEDVFHVQREARLRAANLRLVG